MFAVPSGKKVAAFRRGSYGAQVYCLAFNETSTILCASSDTGTIHFFSLTGTESSATGSFGYIAPITSTLAVAGSTFGSTVFGSAPSSSVPIPAPSTTAKPAGGLPIGVSPTRSSRSSSGSSSLDDVAGAVSAYLPGSISGIAEGTRDFAYVSPKVQRDMPLKCEMLTV